MTLPTASRAPARFTRGLLALIVGQVCLHAAMAGARLAAPLHALREGHSEWVVGVLFALFALAPIALALPAGRFVDRRGYHAPMALAVALTVVGAALAAATQHLVALGAAAVLCGAGANIGLIAIQRTAGRLATTGTDRMRVFSWLGLAPALANVAGPVVAGLLIDQAGIPAAFAAMAVLAAAAIVAARRVPPEPPRPVATAASVVGPGTWALFMQPGMRRLLLINWLVSSSWDVHHFLVPVLGHERGLSASAIGLILGLFAASVAAVRLLIPLVAHRLREQQVLRGAMLLTGAVFVAYPFMHSAVAMAVCAALLGQALGAVQPMILSTLHRLAPPDRHGEAIAFRSMTINLSSTAMPLVFGALGTSIGAAVVFWAMAAAVGAGSWLPARLPPPPGDDGHAA
ncbi:MAG: MFS transporter [Ideonella sp.]|nr:MFS transporter [Ideonella sp.]